MEKKSECQGSEAIEYKQFTQISGYFRQMGT